MPSSEFEKMASDVLYEFSQTVCVQARFGCQPICQVCGIGKPVHITRWGEVLVACMDCICKERERFNEHCRQQDLLDEETDW